MTDLRLANCSDPGCLSREITYVAPKNQIEALVQQSGKCRQFIRVRRQFHIPLRKIPIKRLFDWYAVRLFDGSFGNVWCQVFLVGR